MKGNSKLKSSFHKIILALLLMPFAAIADWGLNMTQGVTPISQEIYDMHMLTLW
ncbi:MAG TPA: cytochrome c oxidase subunit II, partial [Methylophilaceae bacterium]|nr:cytochrome c oxidase subunit II [Methylophilaceae bacterium]